MTLINHLREVTQRDQSRTKYEETIILSEVTDFIEVGDGAVAFHPICQISVNGTDERIQLRDTSGKVVEVKSWGSHSLFWGLVEEPFYTHTLNMIQTVLQKKTTDKLTLQKEIEKLLEPYGEFIVIHNL